MIILKGICKAYPGITVLQNIYIRIPDNTIFGIIGKSGAGKSTLLRIASLLEKPDNGEVIYDSQRVDILKGRLLLEQRRKMGMIFQNFNLLGSRNAADNIAYPLEIAGMNRKEINKRVDELLEMVGIKDKRKARMSELSGGQKQRVAIARMLAAKPPVMIFDDSLSAVDTETDAKIRAGLKFHIRDAAVIIISHRISTLMQADKILVLKNGTVEALGSHKELVKQEGTYRRIFDMQTSGMEDYNG